MIYKLTEICKIIGGGTPKTSISEYWNGNIFWISVKDFAGEGRYVYHTEKKITEKGLKNSSTKLLEKDDIIISARGTVGEIAMIPYPMAFNQSCFGLRGNKLVDKNYLYYFLKTQIKNLKKKSNGAVFDTITTSTFSTITCELPTLIIQSKIAGILSSLDAKIETNNKLNEKLEEMAQAIFKSWFVDFEPFKDKPFHETELGMIPEGWEVGYLSDISTITMGQSPCGTSYNENGEGIIFYQGRTEFGFRFPSVRLYTTAPSRFAEVGSTLMSVRAPVGDINMALVKCCIGRGVASIKSNCDCDSYIYYLMKSLKKRFDIYNGEGTVFGSVGRDTLRNMSITIPPSSVISDFETNISKIDSRIKTNELESKRLASLRDTLLPRLMSGELKV